MPAQRTAAQTLGPHLYQTAQRTPLTTTNRNLLLHAFPRPGDGPSSSSRPPASASAEPLTTTADWVARKARTASRSGLVAAAVSSDGRYLAVGGGDARVHVLDAGSGAYVQGFPGHKDMVTGLAFRWAVRDMDVLTGQCQGCMLPRHGDEGVYEFS